ncbi:hypothetical protein DFH06DRAFT_1208446 [Mycena polygramma]|nr:hypothetical protein DFH06DRAFT_1208446 [Mycena polygramma]
MTRKSSGTSGGHTYWPNINWKFLVRNMIINMRISNHQSANFPTSTGLNTALPRVRRRRSRSIDDGGRTTAHGVHGHRRVHRKRLRALPFHRLDIACKMRGRHIHPVHVAMVPMHMQIAMVRPVVLVRAARRIWQQGIRGRHLAPRENICVRVLEVLLLEAVRAPAPEVHEYEHAAGNHRERAKDDEEESDRCDVRLVLAMTVQAGLIRQCRREESP